MSDNYSYSSVFGSFKNDYMKEYIPFICGSHILYPWVVGYLKQEKRIHESDASKIITISNICI
jgi:hypothetical protein